MTSTSCSPPGGKQGHYLGQEHLTCGTCLSLTISYICSNEIPEQNVHLIHYHILKHSFRIYQHMHNLFILTFRALGRNQNFLNSLSKISFPISKFCVFFGCQILCCCMYESDNVSFSTKIAYKNVRVSQIDLITREKSTHSFIRNSFINI